MQITVTQKHIDDGKVFSFSSCPIALAIKEALKADHVWVSSLAEVYQQSNQTTHFLPDIVKAFITNFDAQRPVAPFSFEML